MERKSSWPDLALALALVRSLLPQLLPMQLLRYRFLPFHR